MTHELGSCGTVGSPIERAGFRVRQVLYREVRRLPVHAHPMARICLTREGQFRETIAGTEFQCRPGTVLFRPPSAPHSDRFGNGLVRNVLIEVEPQRLEGLGSGLCRIGAPALVFGGMLNDLPERIERELAASDTTAAVSLEGLLLALAAAVERIGFRRPDPGPAVVVEATAVVDGAFPNRVSVPALAGRLGVSAEKLALEFRRHHGCSIPEYSRRRRIDFAKRALAETTLPISAVALEAGFSDQAHLTREFKRFVGTTPKEFRDAPALHGRTTPPRNLQSLA